VYSKFSEVDDGQTDGSDGDAQHLLNNVLANLETQINLSRGQSSSAVEQGETSTDHAETESEEEEEESMSTISSSEEDGVEEQDVQAEDADNTNEELEDGNKAIHIFIFSKRATKA
jgi:hypothetical protein